MSRKNDRRKTDTDMRPTMAEGTAGAGTPGGRKHRRNMEFQDYMFGDFISARFLRRNIGFILLVVACMMLYVGNGYSSRQEMIYANKLRDSVEDAKYYSLSRAGELIEFTRQSRIEDYLEAKGDTALRAPETPPYTLRIDTAE